MSGTRKPQKRPYTKAEREAAGQIADELTVAVWAADEFLDLQDRGTPTTQQAIAEKYGISYQRVWRMIQLIIERAAEAEGGDGQRASTA